MITFDAARQIAETEINKYQLGTDNLLIDEEIIEKEYAWIFPYTIKRFWETKDFNYAIGGNAPLFISRLDGKVSTYPTGLTIEEMIDEYEEENYIWELVLAEDIFADTKKVLSFRQVLNLTIAQVEAIKKQYKKVLESGSRTRLSEIQNQLSSKNITTHLGQKTVS